MSRKRCFIYCRQSSGCGEAENSLSIQQQLTNCLETAKKMELEVLDVFTDANISGKTYPAGPMFERTAAADGGFQEWFRQQTGVRMFRAGLGEMMKRLGEADYVVLDEMTRLQRSAANSFLEQVLSFEFTRANVKIIQVKGGTLDLNSFDQSLIQLLKTRINDEQISNQKRKSMESRRKLRDAGIFCNVKFYAGVYDGGKRFHFNEGQAEVVKYVFAAFLAGEAPGRILLQTNRLFPGRFGSARCFYASTLRHILSQPLYAGLMCDSSGKLIKCVNAPPPIVSPSDFSEVQRVLEMRQKHRSRPRSSDARNEVLIFSGFLRCAECGANLQVVYDRKRLIYRCPNGDINGSPGCRMSRVLISGGVGDDRGLRATLQPLLAVAWLSRREKILSRQAGMGRAAEARREEKRLRAKMQTAFDLFESDILDESAYRDCARTVMGKIRQIQALLLELEEGAVSAGNPEEEITRCNRGLALLSRAAYRVPDRLFRELLSECVDHIDVGPEKIKIFSTAGTFSLPRIHRDKRQKRVFPLSSLRQSCDGGNVNFEVAFFPGRKGGSKTELVSWKNLKITLKAP